jgi:DNA polymerase-3 subunit epsilon
MSSFRWIGLSNDGETITLKKFSGQFRFAPYVNDAWKIENSDLIRKVAFLDIETTGLNKNSDQIIEIGIRVMAFNRSTGDWIESVSEYSALQDPGVEISPEIQRITGISNEDVKGKQIDWNRVGQMLEESSIVIAHNAAFDRPFVDLKCPASTQKIWGCSLKQIDWSAKYFPTRKLEVLTLYHGFFSNAHRALSDVDSLIHLLSFVDENTRQPYFNELLQNARRPLSLVSAVSAPFECKELLKERGYFWNLTQRVWQKQIVQDQLDLELQWLNDAIYKSGQALNKAQVTPIAFQDMFKA